MLIFFLENEVAIGTAPLRKQQNHRRYSEIYQDSKLKILFFYIFE